MSYNVEVTMATFDRFQIIHTNNHLSSLSVFLQNQIPQVRLAAGSAGSQSTIVLRAPSGAITTCGSGSALAA